MRILSILIASAFFNLLGLDGAWEYRSSVESEWHTGSVPGCVHLDLMNEGLIPDPFYDRNEKLVQWVGEKDWTYRKTFVVGGDVLYGNHQTLVLEGVDTYAKVFLNGEQIAECDNMFRTWRIDVKDKLVPGENTIEVTFESVFRHDMPKYLSAPYKLQAWPNNDQSDIWLSLYARKAGYNYGWDWGPRLITAGLWKSVYIESWSDLVIRPSQVKTLDVSNPSKAEMSAVVEFESDMEGDAVVELSSSKSRLARKKIYAEKGLNRVTLDFVMRNPDLWWPNGLGEHPLYEFDLTVKCGSKVAAGMEISGIRTMEVVRGEDEYGCEMAVRVNGKKVFCKGANYIPSDNFPSRVTAEWYDSLVGSAEKANMNMLRVWGGGIYESDDFLSACDRHGIMVWHDMMFACGMFPADEKYLESVGHEIRDNVRRMRNHPSVALWCGNNENEISYYEWGWNRTLTEEQRASYEKELNHLFRGYIPECISEVDDTRYYHPGSPNTGYNGIGYNMGDAHYWGVWKGAWVEEYLKPEHIARFMSEYGFQSYPCSETIKEYIPESGRKVGSPSMLAHQKAHDDVTRDPNFGDRMIIKYMEHYYKKPDSFEDFVYLSQYQQAEAIKIAIEAHRRAKPYCMGTLFWQINDCWPVASWSSIDYQGRWKALQYYAARAYSEVIVSPYREDTGKIAVKVVSDRTSGFDAVLEVRVVSMDGRILYRNDSKIRVPADGSVLSYVPEMPEHDCVLYVRLLEKGHLISDNWWISDLPNTYSYRQARPSFRVVSSDSDRMTLRIESDVVICGLHISSSKGVDLDLEDDYVTIIPGYYFDIEMANVPLEDLVFNSLNHILL